MSILITGSKGFIGKHLLTELKNENHVSIEVNRDSYPDLKDEKIIDILPRCDNVIHLAAKIFSSELWNNPHLIYDNNINSTLNMLEYSRRNGVDKFIFPSTYVYGNSEKLPVDEDQPVKCMNPYCHSKIICEELCKSYSREYGIKVVILRFFNIYGPCQGANRLIPDIISQVGKKEIVLENGSIKRDYIYISDVVRSILCSLDYKKSDFEIFNIGSGESHSVYEIIDLIQRNIDSTLTVSYKNEFRKNEIYETKADISKAKRLLNWEPEVTMEEGLNRTLNYSLNKLW